MLRVAKQTTKKALPTEGVGMCGLWQQPAPGSYRRAAISKKNESENENENENKNKKDPTNSQNYTLRKFASVCSTSFLSILKPRKKVPNQPNNPQTKELPLLQIPHRQL